LKNSPPLSNYVETSYGTEAHAIYLATIAISSQNQIVDVMIFISCAGNWGEEILGA
jgi:hypothetical protein